MVYEVKISSAKDAPINYLENIDALKTGSSYKFKPGVNVIVGKNGCGKSTLIELISQYLLITNKHSELTYHGLDRMYGFHDNFRSGVEVFADYTLQTYKMRGGDDVVNKGDGLEDFARFTSLYTHKHSSTGESLVFHLSEFFKFVFSPNTERSFPDLKTRLDDEKYNAYISYVESHKIPYKKGDEPCYTLLMDEPDRNLDFGNIGQIYDILSAEKENTQIIAVIHNPVLIYALSRIEHINFIEMTPGYIDEIKAFVDKYTKYDTGGFYDSCDGCVNVKGCVICENHDQKMVSGKTRKKGSKPLGGRAS